jgi:hypothetical protein
MTKFSKPKDSCSKTVQLLHTAAAVLGTSTATLAFQFSWLHYCSQCTSSGVSTATIALGTSQFVSDTTANYIPVVFIPYEV